MSQTAIISNQAATEFVVHEGGEEARSAVHDAPNILCLLLLGQISAEISKNINRNMKYIEIS